MSVKNVVKELHRLIHDINDKDGYFDGQVHDMKPDLLENEDCDSYESDEWPTNYMMKFDFSVTPNDGLYKNEKCDFKFNTRHENLYTSSINSTSPHIHLAYLSCSLSVYQPISKPLHKPSSDKYDTMSTWLITCLCVVILSTTSQVALGQSGGENKIPAVASRLGLSELVRLAGKAGLVPTLNGEGPLTVFGPTNMAFENLPKKAKEAIKDDDILAKILKFHVLSGKVLSTDLQDELQVETFNGAKLRVNLYPKGVTPFSVATVQCAPIDTNNVDKEASNGVVHVIKKVMLPPKGPISNTLDRCGFNTLVTALKAAGLFDTLNGDGPFTLFAPKDEAFEKLPDGTLDYLLSNVTALTIVLKYHVVSGTYCSAGLTSGDVTTLSNDDITINVSDSGVTVEEIPVIKADKSVTNGVIHVIDGVLVPPGIL